MLILKSTAYLQLKVFGGATSELQFYTTFYDGPSSSFGDNSGVSNGTTPVTIIGPTIGQYREVKFISICNKYNGGLTATVILEIVKDSNTTQLVYTTLDEQDTLLYDAADGFKVVDKYGKLKVTVAAGGSGGGGSGTVTSVTIASGNGFTGSVVNQGITPALTIIPGNITPTAITSTGLITTSGDITTTGTGNISSAGTIISTGNISGANLSGTNTGDQTTITGNAGTATALQTPRTINGVSFNGTTNITVDAAAGTLTGTTLASGVTSSSLTSVGTLANLTVTNPIAGSITGNAATATLAALATTVTTNANLTGPITSSGNATGITNNVITNNKLVQVSSISFKGRNAAVAGDVQDLTPAEATAILNAFTPALQGLVPASGGGTANFLRADGTWTAPAGGGGGGPSLGLSMALGKIGGFI